MRVIDWTIGSRTFGSRQFYNGAVGDWTVGSRMVIIRFRYFTGAFFASYFVTAEKADLADDAAAAHDRAVGYVFLFRH
jgi:hypothetical protein